MGRPDGHDHGRPSAGARRRGHQGSPGPVASAGNHQQRGCRGRVREGRNGGRHTSAVDQHDRRLVRPSAPRGARSGSAVRRAARPSRCDRPRQPGRAPHDRHRPPTRPRFPPIRAPRPPRAAPSAPALAAPRSGSSSSSTLMSGHRDEQRATGEGRDAAPTSCVENGHMAVVSVSCVSCCFVAFDDSSGPWPSWGLHEEVEIERRDRRLTGREHGVQCRARGTADPAVGLLRSRPRDLARVATQANSRVGVGPGAEGEEIGHAGPSAARPPR